MLISGYALDMHVNPDHIVAVWKTGSRETYYFAKIRDWHKDIDIDKDSYDRIVKWLERRDG